jgi:hypothetical protein
MSTQKKMLSLEELEAQTLLELPDRELMHVSKHRHGGSTTNTTFICGAQDNSNSGNALLQVGTLFIPINANILSCNNVSF